MLNRLRLPFLAALVAVFVLSIAPMALAVDCGEGAGQDPPTGTVSGGPGVLPGAGQDPPVECYTGAPSGSVLLEAIVEATKVIVGVILI